MFAESGSGAIFCIARGLRNEPYLRIEEMFDLGFFLISGEDAHAVPSQPTRICERLPR